MAFTDPGAVTGGTTPARATWANDVRADLLDHESRIGDVEAGANALLTADPASPGDDTWWVVRDNASPETAALKVRIGGVTYTIASITL